MTGVSTVTRLTIVPAAAAFICAAGVATARDTAHGLSVAIVSNGVVTYKIPNGPDGLELSSNGPGTITVTSGSNSVTVRGPSLTLSGAVALAPFPTPGVRVTPNNAGGYTVALDMPLAELPDIDTPEEVATRLAKDLARELADADFGDGGEMASKSASTLASKLGSKSASKSASVPPDSLSACNACTRVTAGRCAPSPDNSASP